jgi:HAD superfamily hydrolase (TIGR01509 family)
MISCVIFDCDGVLVDSEYLANKVNAETFIPYLKSGWTEEYFVHSFRGWPDQDIALALENERKKQFPEDLHKIIVRNVDERLNKELTAIRGMTEVINRISSKVAVASNSPKSRLERSIVRANLEATFKKNVFSPNSVICPKPAPDIYLHTAKAVGVEPSECLVVEDSERGVIAAVRAGMKVIGFTGGKHCVSSDADLLTNAGAFEIAKNSLEFEKVLSEFGLIQQAIEDV